MDGQSIIAFLTALMTLITTWLTFFKERNPKERLVGRPARSVLYIAFLISGLCIGGLSTYYIQDGYKKEIIDSLSYSTARNEDLRDEINRLKQGDAWTPPSRATLFEHLDFHGRKLYLHVGDYPDLSQAYFGANVSSIKLEGGVQAILYEKSEFRGKQTTITSNVLTLVTLGWNDRVKSIKVITK